MQTTYSIIIPIYNEIDTLEKLTQSIHDVFAQYDDAYEVIYVDDCSTDGSSDLLAEIADRSEVVKPNLSDSPA
jgi:dolichol-phosphate mannosyltransferase